MRATPVRRGVSKKRFTGNTLVVAAARSSHKSILTATKKASISLARSSDYKNKKGMVSMAMKEADGIYIDSLKIAVVKKDKNDQAAFLASSANRNIQHTEKERYVYASDLEYIRGYRDAVNHLYDGITDVEGGERKAKTSNRVGARRIIEDSDTLTWGLQAAGLADTQLKGDGVRIAVLDTGFFMGHPDFTDRDIVSKSFHRGSPVEDVEGHGTHCVGIACGGNDDQGLRYGVASQSDIYVGKVLDDQGEGTDSSVLSGIGWAVDNNCQIISMSLGGEAEVGEPFSETYEIAAKRALEKGSLIIAAAGNESRRPGVIRPVNHPANCPSIVAVGALHQNLQVANYSNGIEGDWATEVDISAPGSNIYSSYLAPQNYWDLSGTSMATPFVAGVAALLIEQYPNITPDQLWRLLIRNARHVEGSQSAIGAGMVSL